MQYHKTIHFLTYNFLDGRTRTVSRSRESYLFKSSMRRSCDKITSVTVYEQDYIYSQSWVSYEPHFIVIKCIEMLEPPTPRRNINSFENSCLINTE